ncbi:MAG: sugar phosphate isomerase/epimerase family protein [Blastocatellia bacterium]
MSLTSRREFSRALVGALAGGAHALSTPFTISAAPGVNSTFRGVTIGAQSYSFRDRPLDRAIEAMATCGVGLTELWQGHIEPQGRSRDEIRQWRLTTPLSVFHEVRRKFRKAGINLYAYNYSFKTDFTDAEIARGFEMAKALGVKYLTASAQLSVVKRVDAHAGKHKIVVGMHNHSNIKPDEFATPENFAEAMNGSSKYIGVNLDIGHFTAANFDAIDYLGKHHDRIVTLHIKDRRKNQGDNVPFGQGDTPIGPVLKLLSKNRWKIPANIEYEYKGADTIEEVRKCVAHCRQLLEA